jgi:NADPH-ferrihemoprotein reductase
MNGQGLGADKGDQDDEMVDEQVCENLSYFVFGLGNKTYEHFNAISRRLDKRLTKLGGKRIGVCGEGDDDASMEDDYLKWAPTNIKALAEHFGITVDKSSQRSQPHIPMFKVEYVATEPKYRGEHTSGSSRTWSKSGVLQYKEETTASFDAKHPFYSRYLDSRPLYQNSKDTTSYKDSKIVIHSEKVQIDGHQVTVPRQCYHIELDLTGSNLKYTSGDHVGVWANNATSAVQKLAKFLRVDDLDAVIKLNPNSDNKLAGTAKAAFPQPCTIRDALTHYLDISAVMKQHHFEIFSKFASDTKESDLLYDISQDRESYVKFIESSQKTLTCVLEEFPSIQVPQFHLASSSSCVGRSLDQSCRPILFHFVLFGRASQQSQCHCCGCALFHSTKAYKGGKVGQGSPQGRFSNLLFGTSS